MPKGIKKIAKTILIVLATLLLLSGSTLALLRSSRVQNYLVQRTTAYFSDKFGTKVQIASVDLELFNKVLLEEVYLQDLRGDTLLYVGSLKMGFSPLKLIQNEFVCNYIELENLEAKLVLDTQKVFNFNFILEALKKDKKKDSKLSYQLEGISLTNANISYANENKLPKARGFDPNFIILREVSTDINIHKLSPHFLSMEIEHLRLKEKSGFVLSDLQANIKANKSVACLKGLHISLPNSDIAFTPIVLNYGNLKNLKKFGEKTHIKCMLKPSEITLTDLKAFVPSLAHTHGKLYLSTQFKGNVSNMKFKNLYLSYNNDITLRGNFELAGLPNINETFIYAKIKDIKTDKHKLQDLLSNLAGRPLLLPEQFSKLGTIHFKGNISGLFSDMVIYGSLKTKIGNISTDILMGVLPGFEGLNYSGSMHTKQLKIGQLFNENAAVGDITFNLSSAGKILPKGEVKGGIEGNISSVIFKNYTYKNILLKGTFDKRVFDGWVNLEDENAKLDFNGKMDFSDRLPSGKFRMKVDKLNLYKLNIIKDHPDLSMAFNVKTSFTASKIEETDTDILIDSFYLYNKYKELFLERIYIESKVNDTLSVININSDLVKGGIKGKTNLLSLDKSFTNLLSNYIPSIKKPEKGYRKNGLNDFVFYFTDFHIDALADILEVPLTLSPKTLISGFYNDKSDKFRLEVLMPKIQHKKNTYTDLNILCNNNAGRINIRVNSKINEKTKLDLISNISNDSIQLDIDWQNPHIFSGSVSTLGLISRNQENKLLADIQINPSQLWLRDSLWNMRASNIQTDLKTLRISDFAIEHNDQYVKIDGVASNTDTDTLLVRLNQVRLRNIMDIAKVRTPKMDGLVTGNAIVKNVFSKMILELDIFAKDFTFNNALWGDVKMRSYWDGQQKKLIAKGHAVRDKKLAFDLAGEYFPRNDSMEFYADIKKLEMNFLRYYLDGALQNVSGDASGKLRIFGGLKHICFEGNILAKNGRFNVDFLRTSYHFTDTIYIKKEEIRFKNISVMDPENHAGVLNGWLTHKNFKDMRFRFDIKGKNIMAMNTTVKDNENFYGKAYGTGTIRVQGTSSQVNFTINMKTDPKTKMTIPMVTSAYATENSFIQFVSKPNPKKSNTISYKSNSPISTPSKTIIHVYLQLEMTPDGEIVLITDPVGGDYIRAVGNGNLRIDYDTNEDIKLYGTYEVEKGVYMFTLQQVIRKFFDIKRGGTMRWSGDPYEAIIDLNASYTVPSVSLLDILDESQLEGASRTSLQVNCLLNLTGNLMRPTIKFDLELPSDPELQRRIKNIINTDEMMNREMLALLVMNRFYKPDYLQSEKTGLGTEVVSVISTTVSGQLNNWLSKINDKVNVSLNARLANGQDLTYGGEYKIGLMYQPNNRLILNSNVGYNNDILTPTTSNFIGDLDVEYKLNKSGKLRAKAYTHTADNFYVNPTGNAYTTQGLGLMYREDFNSLSDVFRYYFNKKPAVKDSVKTTNTDSIKTKNKDEEQK